MCHVTIFWIVEEFSSEKSFPQEPHKIISSSGTDEKKTNPGFMTLVEKRESKESHSM
jgi:hypothetical protein